ncbi:recombination protein RecR [bacterium]|nr:recombination protein RecR [bacterium]
MEYSSRTLESLIEALCGLPGIGTKSAQRIALHLVQGGKNEAEHLARSIMDLHDKVSSCSVCFNLTEDDPCAICRDPKRDESRICVLEEPKDLMAVERTGIYNGKYHVLGGVLSPLDGVGESHLHIQELMKRIHPGISEIIIATNPTVEGELTASYLARLLKPMAVRVTRIARGIPYGGSLEFNDMVTLSKAMEGRLEVDS